jgi:hypothetical protein
MGGLRRARDLLRPMVDGPLEYRMRRAVGRLIPARDATGPPHLFHACAWKTGSQWVRLILSDLRLLRYGGHAPFIWAHLRDLPGHLEGYQATSRTLLLTGYGPPETLFGLRDTPMRGIFVIRDPRALLASWITSTRYTHRPNAGVLAHRKAMAGMSEADALAYAGRAFVTEFAPVLDGWRKTGPETLPVRFEDLTGEAGEAVWQAVLAHLGIQVPDQVLRAVLRTYRIEALASPHPQPAEADKYALRGRRSWEGFAQGDLPTLEPLFDWARAYGYPATEG